MNGGSINYFLFTILLIFNFIKPFF